MSSPPALLNTLTDSKNAIQQQVAKDLLEDYAMWRKEARSSDDPKKLQHLVEYQTRVIGAEVDRKTDANANLPIFNFTFHAPTGAMSAVVTMPQDPVQPAPKRSKAIEVIEVIEAVEAAEVRPVEVPTAVTLAQNTEFALSRKDLPDDLMDLMAQIPGMMADD